jgi:hypothetical protein
MNKEKKTLSEELKKFKILSEYDFYVPESYEETSNNLLGEEEPADEEDGIGDTKDFESEEPQSEEPQSEEPQSDGPIDFSGDDSTNMEPQQNMSEPPVDDAVELDVTELVKGTEDAKMSSDLANKQLQQLSQKFDQLVSTVSKIELINKKIDSLEHEIEKRNPTEVEKLEMRSLDSFPFNVKLTDYWSDKENQYDVMDKNNEKNEYVLTQNDIEKDFNDLAVRDSFEDFDEEEI